MLTLAEARHYLNGPVMSLATSFHADGTIDYQGVKAYIDASIANGSKTVMLTAGDSHYIVMSDEQIAELTRFVCQYVGKRAMIIAADRYFDTRQVLAFASFCKDCGVDMFMVMPPDWAGSCSSETMAEHYAAVANILPVMIVTNVFALRGAAFGLETLDRAMTASKNILAVKDDLCGVFATDLAAQFHERCAIIAGGQKMNHLLMQPYGCTGYLSTFITFKPEIAWAYWKAIEKNDLTAAAQVAARYDKPFFDHICSAYKGSFDAAIHGMLELYGLAGRYRPKPYATLSDEEMAALKDFLLTHKLL